MLSVMYKEPSRTWEKGDLFNAAYQWLIDNNIEQEKK